MKLNKFFVLSIVLIMSVILLMAGCNNEISTSSDPTSSSSAPSGGGKTNLNGSLEDIAKELIKKADDKIENEMDKFPAGMGSMAEIITKEDVKGHIGITPEQFTSNVKSAVLIRSMIGTFPDEIFLIECNDEAAATLVTGWIPDAYDTEKNICTAPSQSFVIQSGQYVLLVATTNARAEAVLEVFKTMADNTSDVNIFFQGDGDSDGGDIENPGFGGGPAQID